MNFIKKAMKAGISPANILSWLAIQYCNHINAFFSTFIFYAKSFFLGVKTGAGIKVNGKILLARWPGGIISIGDNVSLVASSRRATASSLALPMRFRVFGKGRIIIGNGCELSGVSITARSKSIILGENVLIAPNCVIVDSDFHIHWPACARSKNPGFEMDSPVTIGDNVWIGMNCLVLKGVSIGENSIIGAGSVVTRSIPPNCVACGNPARVIRNYEND